LTDRESILVVDDNPDMRKTICKILERDGYRVTEAEDGIQLHQALAENTIDLLLLDLVLGKDDGLKIAQEIQNDSNMPIIIISGKNDVIDKVVGLEIGADDYITKPFHARELIARVGSVLRRYQRSNQKPPTRSKLLDRKIATFSGWRVDLIGGRLTSPEGRTVSLTTFEFQVLTIFIEHANQTLSRDQIMESASSREWFPNDRSLDVLIGKIRKKLNDKPRNPEYIRTIRNRGYIFIAEVNFD